MAPINPSFTFEAVKETNVLDNIATVIIILYAVLITVIENHLKKHRRYDTRNCVCR
jgi:hypothetical protein